MRKFLEKGKVSAIVLFIRRNHVEPRRREARHDNAQDAVHQLGPDIQLTLAISSVMGVLFWLPVSM